jgi:hypothetical protein
VCTLQPRLSTTRQQHAATKTAPSWFDVGKLQQQQVRQQFVVSMHNRFTALTVASAASDAAGGPQDAEAEWQAFMQATQATAAAELGPQPRQHHKEGLPQLLLDTIQQKHNVFALWQQKEQQWHKLEQETAAQQSSNRQQQVTCAAAAAEKAKRKYRHLNHLVDRRLAKQRNIQLAAHAAKAERQWKAGHLAAFHKTVSRLFKDKPTKTGAQGLLSKDGSSVYRSTQEQLTRFTEYFAEVFSGECVTPEQQQHMEQLIARLETLLLASAAGPSNSAEGSGSSGSGSSGDNDGDSSGGSNGGSSSSSSNSSGGGSSPPSLQEVVDAIAALPDAAAGGADNIVTPLLKSGLVMAQWLHCVIVAVWMSGKAPLDWKRALIVPLFKGRGSARDATNHRPISLLSIPGKVYALILLHRVSDQVDSQLLESQCAFRSKRGLSDATYTLRSIMYKSYRYKQSLYLAFVDLRKAYDSIPRDALWRVLSAYGVEPKVIELLADLHTGTQAAVKLANQHGDWFDIGRGVRQGCVIAPLLFNVFFDCVVRPSLAEMPDGCGVRLAFRAEGEVLPWHARAGGPRTMLTLAALMYAYDLVLMSCDRDELELMLKVFDSVCSRMGMCVNAAKTECAVSSWLCAIRVSRLRVCSYQVVMLDTCHPSNTWVVWLTRLQAGRLRLQPALARLGAGLPRCSVFGVPAA